MFDMTWIANLIKREVGRQLSSRTHPRVGLVTSYDKKGSVKVQYQPDGSESGWIPVGRHQHGSTVHFSHGPTPGDQVQVTFLDGDMENPVITHFLHSDQDPHPTVESGETYLQHIKTGSSMKIDKTGAWTSLTQGQTYTINTNGGAIVITGGNVTITATSGQLA